MSNFSCLFENHARFEILLDVGKRRLFAQMVFDMQGTYTRAIRYVWVSLSHAVDYVKAFFRKGAFWFSKNRKNSDTFHENHAIFK
jgi:hypothetical protein